VHEFRLWQARNSGRARLSLRIRSCCGPRIAQVEFSRIALHPATQVFTLLYQSCSVRKVSQLETVPDFKPVMNQRARCAEEPWVKASGTT